MQGAGCKQASHQANHVDRLGSLLAPGLAGENHTQNQNQNQNPAKKCTKSTVSPDSNHWRHKKFPMNLNVYQFGWHGAVELSGPG